MFIKHDLRDDGRVAVSVWRGAPHGQPDIDGFYRLGTGDTSAIHGASIEEADLIARFVDAQREVDGS